MVRAIQRWLSGSIKRQVVFVFTTAVLVYAVIHWQIEQRVLRPQFVALQETEAREQVQRCVSVIEHEIHMTSRKAADWAAWDDTYQFVRDLTFRVAVAGGDEMSMLQDGLNGMLQSLEQADRALRESEDTYRCIFKSVLDGLLVLNTKGAIKAANGSTCHILEYTPEQLEGRAVSDLVRGDDRDTLTLLLQTTRHKGQGSADIAFVCADGARLPLHVCSRTIRRKGRPRFLVVLRDAAEQREIETSRREAQQDAEDAAQFKSGLLRNVTHEMRTPLNHIIGFAEFLSDEPLSETQRQCVRSIQQGGKDLRDLVNSILDVARIEADTLVLTVQPCSLTALIHELKTIGKSRADSKALDFDVICMSSLPETLTTDVDRLRQCLLMLVDNAVKFTDQGQVEIHVTAERQDRQAGVTFAVRDTGPGIADELHEDIFTSFAQGDSSVTRPCGGLGTGLAIAHRLAELLGGGITLQSEVGQGSVFTLFVPIAIQPRTTTRV